MSTLPSQKRFALAARIWRAMESKGYSVRDLAAAVGISQSVVEKKWLSGEHNFEMNTLLKIEQALDIELIKA